MYKILCIILFTFFFSEVTIAAQTYMFQTTPQSNTVPARNRTPLSSEQFQKNVSGMAEKNRQALAIQAKKNQPPLPSNVLPPKKPGLTAKQPSTEKPPEVLTNEQPMYYEPTSQPGTTIPENKKSTPKTPSTPPNQSTQNPYYTGFPSTGGGATPNKGGSTGQWNINY